MKDQLSPGAKAFACAGALIAWFAVLLQLYLLLLNRETSVPEALARFFSYFTILTNILVAMSFTAVFFQPESGWMRFFSRPQTLAATAVYIIVVGTVYNIILRSLWEPAGWQLVADELLHSIIPAAFVLFWLIYVPKDLLQWKNIFPWLIYPLVYVIGIFFRGLFSGFFPYPFIDVNELGYGQVLINCFLMVGAFIFFCLLIVMIAKAMTKSRL